MLRIAILSIKTIIIMTFSINISQHYNVEQNDAKHNGIQQNDTQHNDIQQNDTLHNSFSKMTLSIRKMTLSIMRGGSIYFATLMK
jgi:hypothetical protein